MSFWLQASNVLGAFCTMCQAGVYSPSDEWIVIGSAAGIDFLGVNLG